MVRARIDYLSLADASNTKQAQNAQLRIVQRLAHDIDAILVRRMNGTYYLSAGSIHGEVPFDQVPWPERYNPTVVEAAAHIWLCQLADELQAELDVVLRPAADLVELLEGWGVRAGHDHVPHGAEIEHGLPREPDVRVVFDDLFVGVAAAGDDSRGNGVAPDLVVVALLEPRAAAGGYGAGDRAVDLGPRGGGTVQSRGERGDSQGWRGGADVRVILRVDAHAQILCKEMSHGY